MLVPFSLHNFAHPFMHVRLCASLCMRATSVYVQESMLVHYLANIRGNGFSSCCEDCAALACVDLTGLLWALLLWTPQLLLILDFTT